MSYARSIDEAYREYASYFGENEQPWSKEDLAAWLSDDFVFARFGLVSDVTIAYAVAVSRAAAQSGE